MDLKSNMHLIPPPVLDLVEKFNTEKSDNVKQNYLFRIEAIKQYLDETLVAHNLSNNVGYLFKRNAKTKVR